MLLENISSCRILYPNSHWPGVISLLNSTDMKKILLFFGVAAVLFFAFAYLFIPDNITISTVRRLPVNKNGLFRKLADTAEWPKWWSQHVTGKPANETVLNGIKYQLTGQKMLSLPVSLSKKGFICNGEFTLIPAGVDSCEINFHTIIPATRNPINRITSYFTARTIKKNTDYLFRAIGTYYSATSHLYDYDIQKGKVVDSTLLFTFREIKTRPDVATVYSMIDELKSYIRRNETLETGYPMLNVYSGDSITYLVKVALPVNKKLPDSGNISYRWMLGGGNILITEVRGGPGEIRKAYGQVNHYISDHNRIAPAIPFESLVTDRRSEPDTTKWITRIYYPVM